MSDINITLYDGTASTVTVETVATGPRGSDGDKGDKGDTGADGPAVSDGDKGDITISGSGTIYTIDPDVLTSAGRAIIDDADAAAQRATLGLGTAALSATGDFDAAGSAAAAQASAVQRANHTGTQAVGTITGLATIATSGSASDLSAGTVATARLGTGAVGAGLKYLADDQTYKTVAAGSSTVDVVSNIATSTILGRITAGSGDSEELTPAQTRTLLNVADGATANATDAALRARASHTGTQALATISDAGTAAALNAPAAGNAASGEVVKGSDTRLTDTRTPSSTLAHASSHAVAGSDPVTLAQSQVTSLTSDLALKASASSLSSHIADTANPHAVTKAQVGLGSVDNTSDASKPVSTAQAAADALALAKASNLSDLASAATARTNLGLGTAATQASSAFDAAGAAAAAQAASQPLDSDLTTIAGLTATTDSFLQSKASAWAARTIAQVKADLGLTGTNSGDQDLSGLQPLDSDLTAIAALSTTSYGRAFLALADAAAGRTALGLGTLATQSGTFSGTSSGTNTGDQDLSGLQPLDSDLTAIAALATTSYGRAFLALADAAAGRTALALGTLATQSGTFSGTSSGTNTGDNTVCTSGAATTAATLLTPRAINGTNFDGSAAITVTAAAGTLAGATLASGVTASSLTSFGTSPALVTPLLGTPTSGTLTNCTFPTLNQNTSGSAASLSVSGQTGLVTLTGLASTNRAKTVRDAADTILELGGSYTPTGTWTNLTLVTPALGTPASGVLSNCTTATVAVDTNTTAPASTAFVLAQAASATPLAASGSGAVGTSTRFARADHVHPAGSGGGSTNMFIGAAEMIPRTTNGCGIGSSESSTNKVNYDTLDFDAAAIEYAQFVRILPNNWSAGTVTAKFIWTADSGSGDAIFGLSGRAFTDATAIDTAQGTAQTATDTLTAASQVDTSAATSAITIGGSPANGVPVIFEVYRNATAGGDTLAVDARLIGIEITYT